MSGYDRILLATLAYRLLDRSWEHDLRSNRQTPRLARWYITVRHLRQSLSRYRAQPHGSRGPFLGTRAPELSQCGHLLAVASDCLRVVAWKSNICPCRLFRTSCRPSFWQHESVIPRER